MQTKLEIPYRPQWYTRDGTPVNWVPNADGTDLRRPTLRDARGYGYLPDSSQILRVVAQPGVIPPRVAAVARLALAHPVVSPNVADPVIEELCEQADNDVSASLAFAAGWRSAVLNSLGASLEAVEGVDTWESLQAFRYVWLQNIRQVYWTDKALVSPKGYVVRADMLVEHRSTGVTLIDLRTQGLPKPGATPKPKLGWLEKLAAAREILGPGVRVCTLIASPDAPGTLWEVWCSPAHIQRATSSWKAARTLWQSLTGYDPRPKRKGGVCQEE
jgi:hypothetical protein